MIKIRLARKGAKKNPFYHIVVIEESAKRDGKPLDTIGYWSPTGPRGANKTSSKLQINKKSLDSWLTNGAKVTAAVKKLLE